MKTKQARQSGHEFLFRHKLYQSHRDEKLSFPAIIRFSFPPHWHYDLLRGLDYLRSSDAVYNERMGCRDEFHNWLSNAEDVQSFFESAQALISIYYLVLFIVFDICGPVHHELVSAGGEATGTQDHSVWDHKTTHKNKYLWL